VPDRIAALLALRTSLDAGGFFITVVLGVLGILIAVRWLRRHGGRAGTLIGGVIALAVVVASLVGIGALTLFGGEGLGAAQRLELDPLLGARGWSGIAWRPVVDNVTLFVPLGAALGALLCRRRAVVVLGAALLVSVGIEAFQWAFPTGRIANTADIIANGAGAMLGITLARVTRTCSLEATAPLTGGA
jgi:hypothetical protein